MIFLIMVMASAYFWRLLPEAIPTQFNADGSAKAYSSRDVVALLLPGIYLFLALTLPQMVALSPKALGLTKAQNLIARTMVSVGFLFGSIHFGLLMNSANPNRFPPALFISVGLGLFMITLGLTLETIERNFLIGFRTPWNMASDANWKATHRFGAKVMVVTGALTLVMSLFATPSLIAAISSLIFAAVIPIFYSLWYFQNMEKPGEQK